MQNFLRQHTDIVKDYIKETGQAFAVTGTARVII